MPKAEEAVLPEFVLLIDDRERTPYQLTSAKKAHLRTGDYTVEGYEDVFAVERKSYEDVYSCLTTNRRRLAAQLKRLGAMKHSYLLIDCTLAAFMLGHVFHKLSGPDALTRLTRMCVEHGVPFIFCDRYGPQLTGALLLQFWKAANA